MARICERLNGKPHGLLVNSLTETLRAMRTYRPDDRTVTSLLTLKEHPAWIARQEAARMLSRIAEHSEAAREGLRELLKDRDSDVRAHAALGLWQAGHREGSIAKAIVHGLNSSFARMPPVRGLGLRGAFVKLLESEDADVRMSAASVLGNWGYQAEATPALVKLLESEDAYVRIPAPEVLANWGHQAEATPALVKLLESEAASVRMSAAEVLGKWGHQAEATPALVKLLESEDADVRMSAAKVLGRWGHQAEATPALVKLLEDADAYIRMSAAEVLGNWRGVGDVRRTVLSGLDDDVEPAVDFLGRESPGPPSPEYARLLIRLIEPRSDDTPQVEGRRVVVFRWLWQASQLAE